MKAIVSVILLAIVAIALVLPLSENSFLPRPPPARRVALRLRRNSSKIQVSLRRPPEFSRRRPA